MRKQIGDYFIDVSKLVFGGVVLSTVLDIDSVPKMSILIIGICATVLLAIFGFLLIKEK